MELTVKQKLFLKSRAHQLKPVVMAGQKGITESLIKETLAALEAHELIKIKIAGEREAREAAAQEISEKTGAALVQIVGGNATLFKKRKEKSQFQLPRE
ncbi:ribosome assembly RNA-binding protein YhbY [Succinimonas sp.]|uniref:ribosome assembly RNA-binding protein YhbY n=1 Tax=Succinimonas sp. TaxID=1936151 RepID=UPI002E89BD88|nr:ribosome assembly RNA-binding protein YhbY [Succinimonas sp.]MEE3421217.1 ribosome assembly RNA-binding protein YhbY [Succinimonas sp.]